MFRLILALLLLAAQGGDVAQDVRTARQLGRAYYEEGNYKAAAEQFRKVLHAQPRQATFADHFNLGLALMSVPDDAGALAELETARQMQPNSPAPLYALGILNKRQGRFEEALKYFQQVEKVGADMATLFNEGAVHMAMGRSEDALATFRRLLDRGFDFGPSWYLAAEYRVARLLQRLGRVEEAAQMQQRWEARRKTMKDPNDSPSTLELGPLASPQTPQETMAPKREAAAPVFVPYHGKVEKPATPDNIIRFDYDVDGDLDELSVPAKCGAPKLRRNNGNKTFTDVTAQAGIVVPGGKAVCAIAVADLDNDGDIDIVAVGPDGAWLFNNLRGGKFEVLTPFGNVAGTDLATADLDGDGAFDVVFGSSSGLWVWWNGSKQLLPLQGGKAPFAVADLNGDGLEDIAAAGGNRLQFWLNLAGRRFQPLVGPPIGGAVHDIRGHYSAGGAFLLEVEAGTEIAFRRTVPKTHWLGFSFEGVRSNKEGVGAVVEVKAGNFYTRRLATTEPLVIETGDLARVDVVRVTWPNGIIQNVINTPADRELRVSEQDRLASSCPLLYLWDGSRFRFFAEVLSSTPLGEPDGRGGFILPGTSERVFIPGAKMVARNGRYVFQLTEELREAIYLDRARLVALDHPAGTRAFVDEAYRSAPAGVAPLALADVQPLAFHRVPAVPREDTLPGLVERNAVYFDAPAGTDSLVLRGWTYWMDSNIATAASQDPAREALPPRLEAQQRDGAWKTVIEDLGLPAGAGRYVVAGLRGRQPACEGQAGAGACRYRIVTNLRVTWDGILAGKAAAAPLAGALAPLRADLHYRGFSQPTISPARSAPDFYDYSHLMDEAPWDVLPGRYTRYGDVGPLLATEDDELVVFGAGDELTLEFSADRLPQARRGWQRDFVLELSGWAKAGETNTASSASIEPLPFRGMKQYPYVPAGERAWQRRWLTRRPMPHLPPLAPAY